MSFEKKLKKAKKTNWLTKGFTDEEVKKIVDEAKEELQRIKQNQNE